MADAGGASSLGSSVLELRTDDTNLQEGLKRGEEAFGRYQSKALDLAAKIFNLKAAYDVIAGAVDGAIGIMGDFIAEAGESEDAVTQLNAALLASSEFTTDQSDALQQYASQLQETTRYTDEQVLSVQRMLVQFGAGPDKINRMTKAVLDLAAGMGISLDAAARVVGRAIQGNTDMLSRYGIVVDETAKKQADLTASAAALEQKFGGSAASAIKQYAEQMVLVSKGYGDTSANAAKADQMLEKINQNFNGDVRAAAEDYANKQVKLAEGQAEAATTAEKLETALKKIEEHYGGQAAAAGQTFLGLWQRMKNQFNEIYEAIGRLIITSPALRALIETLTEKFKGWAEYIEKNKDSLGKLVSEAIIGFVNWVERAVTKVGEFLTSLNKIGSTADTVAGAVNQIKSFFADLSTAAGAPAYQIEHIGNVWTNVKEEIEKAGITPKIEAPEPSQWDAIKAVAVAKMQEISKAMGESLWQGMNSGEHTGKLFDFVSEEFTKFQKQIFDFGADMYDQFNEKFKGMATNFVNAFRDVLPRITEVFTITYWQDQGQKWGEAAVAGLWSAITGAWERLKAWFAANPLNPLFKPQATGSPTLPFTEYFEAYAPKVLQDFARGVPEITFGVNTGGLSKLVGEWNMPQFEQAISLLKSGTQASVESLQSAIASVREWGDRFRAYQMEAGRLNQDPYGIMTPGIPTVEQQIRGAQMIENALKQLLGQNAAAARQAEIDAAKQQALTAAGNAQTGALARSFTAGTFSSVMTTAVQVGIQRATASRSVFGIASSVPYAVGRTGAPF